MISEVELYFIERNQQGDIEDAFMTLTPIETSCVTELTNRAHQMAREQHAEHASFGPVVPRNLDGDVDYTPKKR